MRVLLAVGVILLLAVVTGISFVEPMVERKPKAAQTNAVHSVLSWPMVDDLLGAPQVEKDGRALFVALPRREQLKVVSAGIHKGKQRVVFIDDRYDGAHSVWPVFTPCYATSIDLASGNQHGSTNL
jgi:hypothetical protein